MRVQSGCLLVVCLLAATSFAQDQNVAERLKLDVHKMLDATISGDSETLFKMTHPKAIEAMGGAEKAKQLLKLSLDSLKASGLKTKLEQVGTPSLAGGDANTFAVVPYTLVMTGAGKKITAKTAVVGYSSDGGNSWKFLNITEQGEKQMKQLLPDFPAELKLPRQEQKIEDLK